MMAAAETNPTTSASTDAAKPIIPLRHRVDVTITETHDGWEATAVLANPAGTIHAHGTHEGKGRGATPSVAAAAAIDATLRARVEARGRMARGAEFMTHGDVIDNVLERMRADQITVPESVVFCHAAFRFPVSGLTPSWWATSRISAGTASLPLL